MNNLFRNIIISSLTLFLISGCICTRKLVPRYKKSIEIKYAANGKAYYDISLVMGEYLLDSCCSTEIEMNLYNHIKSEGLFINKVEYLKDNV